MAVRASQTEGALGHLACLLSSPWPPQALVMAIFAWLAGTDVAADNERETGFQTGPRVAAGRHPPVT